MSESLRIHNATGYTDIDASTPGSYETLTRSAVRNGPGALTFTLKATTFANVHDVFSTAALVEYREDGVTKARYLVDDYRIDRDQMTATVKCVGELSKALALKVSRGVKTSTPVSTLLSELCAAIGVTYSATGNVTSTYMLTDYTYKDRTVLSVMQEIAGVAGITFWIDAAGEFCSEFVPTTGATGLAVGVQAFGFSASYKVGDIVNRARYVRGGMKQDGVFDDLASQALYGIRQATFLAFDWTDDMITTHAAQLFAEQATPHHNIGVWCPHGTVSGTGELVEITGLNDGKTYSGLVEQLVWVLGDNDDEISIACKPLAIVMEGTVGGYQLFSSPYMNVPLPESELAAIVEDAQAAVAGDVPPNTPGMFLMATGDLGTGVTGRKWNAPLFLCHHDPAVPFNSYTMAGKWAGDGISVTPMDGYGIDWDGGWPYIAAVAPGAPVRATDSWVICSWFYQQTSDTPAEPDMQLIALASFAQS